MEVDALGGYEEQACALDADVRLDAVHLLISAGKPDIKGISDPAVLSAPPSSATARYTPDSSTALAHFSAFWGWRFFEHAVC